MSYAIKISLINTQGDEIETEVFPINTDFPPQNIDQVIHVTDAMIQKVVNNQVEE